MRHTFSNILSSLGLVLALLGLSLLASSSPWNVPTPPVDVAPADCGQPVDAAWIQKVGGIRWVAYSSPSRQGSVQPSEEALYAELAALRQAGFSGLITYGASGVMGRPFLTIAQELGYEGVILGLWSPTSRAEFNTALKAAKSPIVLGYNIGNEGLSERRDRYTLADLCAAISSLRAATGRPVATSEDIDTYYRRPALLGVGDWVFAIAHPYWHWTKYPREAVQWELQQYAALQERSDRFIFFKEVGLPSDGAPGLSEINQDQYYRALAQTALPFAYFEGFDQPSKAYNSVEPHWGLFHADRAPKLAAWSLMGRRQFIARRTDPLLGRDRDGTVYQPMLSFDALPLPDDALLISAKLKIRVEQVVGFDPLKNGQRLVVDICRSLPGRLPSLDCELGAGTLAKSLGDGWYVLELDVNELPSIQWTGGAQFRLRLEGNSRKDVPRSYLRLSTNGTDSPMLVVRYCFE